MISNFRLNNDAEQLFLSGKQSGRIPPKTFFFQRCTKTKDRNLRQRAKDPPDVPGPSPEPSLWQQVQDVRKIHICPKLAILFTSRF